MDAWSGRYPLSMYKIKTGAYTLNPTRIKKNLVRAQHKGPPFKFKDTGIFKLMLGVDASFGLPGCVHFNSILIRSTRGARRNLCSRVRLRWYVRAAVGRRIWSEIRSWDFVKIRGTNVKPTLEVVALLVSGQLTWTPGNGRIDMSDPPTLQRLPRYIIDTSLGKG